MISGFVPVFGADDNLPDWSYTVMDMTDGILTVKEIPYMVYDPGKINVHSKVDEYDLHVYTVQSWYPFTKWKSSVRHVELAYNIPVYANMFNGYPELKSVKIPDRNTWHSTWVGGPGLGYYAFQGCTKLVNVVIPASVVSIGDDCFRDCSGLKRVVSLSRTPPWTDTYTYNENGPFYNCPGNMTLYVPSGTESTYSKTWEFGGAGAAWHEFHGFSTYTGIIDGGQYGEITWVLPAKSANLKLELYGSGKIPNAAYHPSYGGNPVPWGKFGEGTDNARITSLLMENGITEIGDYAFWGCSHLSSIEGGIPSTVKKIGTAAFEHCSSLTSLTIPSTVTELGSYAFGNCTGLTSLTIPASVKKIGNLCFNNCQKLQSFTVENSNFEYLGDNLFGNTDLSAATLYCPSENVLQYVSSLPQFRKFGYFCVTGQVNKIQIADSITFDRYELYVTLKDNLSKINATFHPASKADRLIWESSNPLVAIVDDEGNINGRNEGVTFITARTMYGNLIASCRVDVYFRIITFSLKVTDNINDSEDEVTDGRLYANTNLSSQKSGLVMYVGNSSPSDGSLRSSAADPDKSGSMSYSGSLFVKGEIYPDYASDKRISWFNSNPDAVDMRIKEGETYVAAVAKNEGTAVITGIANDGNITDRVEISVVNKSVRNINILQDAFDMDVNSEKTVAYSIFPDDAADMRVSWASRDNSIAVVSNGKITAVAPGSTYVVVSTTDGGHRDSCRVTVRQTQSVKVEGIKVTGNIVDGTLTLPVASREWLDFSVIPENAFNSYLVWSTENPFVATVTVSPSEPSRCSVYGVNTGTTHIEVVSQDPLLSEQKKLRYTVNVTKPADAVAPPVESVSISHGTGSLTLFPGESIKLASSVLPAGADINVTWSSSNGQAVSLSPFYEECTVTAKSPGTATITVTAQGGKTARVDVTVLKIPVVSITLNTSSVRMYPSNVYNFFATVHPDNATVSTVTWVSQNESVAVIQSVSGNGCTVRGVAVGNTVVSAVSTDGNVTASANIEVVSTEVGLVPVQEVRMNRTVADIFTGETVVLSAEVLPSNADNKNIKWQLSSSGIDIYSFVKDGFNCTLTGKKAGTVHVQAVSDNGGKTASCTVNISDVTTGTEKIDVPDVSASISGNVLYVSSSAEERITVYSVDGHKLWSGRKSAGNVSFPLNVPDGLLIVRGDSWFKKIINLK
jgi:uncharacterized protein YjdB